MEFPHTPTELRPGSMFTRPGHGTYWVTDAPDAIDADHRSTSVETDQGILDLPNTEQILIHTDPARPSAMTPGQMPGTGLRRTVMVVEILHNDADAGPDPQNMDLTSIAEEAQTGSFSITTSTSTVEVSPATMATLLTNQGSDPSFLLGNRDASCMRCDRALTTDPASPGVLHHYAADSLDGVDHDQDADHAPVLDVPPGHTFCWSCVTAHPDGVADPCSSDYTR